MLGLSLQTFTLLHVIISLVGMVTGLIVLLAMINDKQTPVWTFLFLLTTIATSVTGFMFPVRTVPAQVIGAISLLVLAVAVLAIYVCRLKGVWRPIYVISATFAFYLNVFVGVVQSFQKIPFLQPLAPTQSEPPFAIAQGIVLILFLGLGFLAVRRFHPARIHTV